MKWAFHSKNDQSCSWGSGLDCRLCVKGLDLSSDYILSLEEIMVLVEIRVLSLAVCRDPKALLQRCHRSAATAHHIGHLNSCSQFIHMQLICACHKENVILLHLLIKD